MDPLETFQEKNILTGEERVERMPDLLCTPIEYAITGMEREKSKSIVPYRFDRYIVEIKLDSMGRFLGINGISYDQDFLSLSQRLASIGYIDTDKEYPPD